METTQGTVVELCQPRAWSNPKTGRTINLYSFKIDSERLYFRTGTTNPTDVGLAEGKFVSFQYTPEKQQVDIDTIEVKEQAPQPVQASPQVAAPAGNGAGSREGYWQRKETRDLERDERYINVNEPRMAASTALTAASRVVTAALAHDALSLIHISEPTRPY